jgi:hypothetical protein
MITPAEILRLAQNKYRDFLRAIVTDQAFFPLQIRFGRPRHTDSLPELTQMVQTLLSNSKDRTGTGYTVTCAPVQTRRYGEQNLPVAVQFTNEADFIGSLEREAEVRRFRENLEASRRLCPTLGDEWLAANAGRLIDHADAWPDLMRVCAWFVAHPRPGCYAREIPVPVHTKFIEDHQPILRPLLDTLLANDLDPTADNFFSRYFLRDREPLIRVRLLDPALKLATGVTLADFAVPATDFDELPFDSVQRVVIVENELPLLTLPYLPSTVAIFGRGNAVGLIVNAPWLQRCPRIVYWGDIDAAGLAILARLRTRLPAVQSVLMDQSTLDAYPWAVVEDRSKHDTIPQENLGDSEWACWRTVLQKGSRLEQERIPVAFAHDAIRQAFDPSSVR